MVQAAPSQATSPSRQFPRQIEAKSGVMDGVKIGCGMFIVLPLLIIVGFLVLVAILGHR